MSSSHGSLCGKNEYLRLKVLRNHSNNEFRCYMKDNMVPVLWGCLPIGNTPWIRKELQRLFTLNDPDATKWGQRPWNSCLRNTHQRGLLPMLSSRSFLDAPMVFDFIRKICNNIVKIYLLIKIIISRKASGFTSRQWQATNKTLFQYTFTNTNI